MIRLLAEFALPLVAPTIVYGLWLVWERRRLERQGQGETQSWADAPWIWLGGVGIALMVTVAGVLGLSRSLGDIGGQYVAPRVVDGKVVPAHVDPPRPR